MIEGSRANPCGITQDEVRSWMDEEAANTFFSSEGRWKKTRKNRMVKGIRKYSSERHGYGTWTWADHSTYVGEWKNGKKHGQGIQTRADGAIYHIGTWENGVKRLVSRNII